MNRTIFIAVFACCCVLPFSAYSQKSVPQTGTMTLTVKKIALGSPDGKYIVKAISLVDSKGRTVAFPDDANSWFENAILQDITIPEGTALTLGLGSSGKMEFVPSDDARLLFGFKVGETVYPVGIGVGSKLVVRKAAAGKYTLLPEETIKRASPSSSLPTAKANTVTAIRFKGGTCQMSELVLRPMFAPAEMKEDEKAFMARFKYKLNSGATDETLSALYKEGQFKALDGKAYKAGAAISNDSIYSLVVAVPKDVDVESLKFVFDKQTVPLK